MCLRRRVLELVGLPRMLLGGAAMLLGRLPVLFRLAALLLRFPGNGLCSRLLQPRLLTVPGEPAFRLLAFVTALEAPAAKLREQAGPPRESRPRLRESG